MDNAYSTLHAERGRTIAEDSHHVWGPLSLQRNCSIYSAGMVLHMCLHASFSFANVPRSLSHGSIMLTTASPLKYSSGYGKWG